MPLFMVIIGLRYLNPSIRFCIRCVSLPCVLTFGRALLACWLWLRLSVASGLFNLID